MMLDEDGFYARVLAGVPAKGDKVADLVELLQSRVAEWKANARDVYASGGGKAPDMLEFEFRTWELGEGIRRSLQKRARWKKDQAFLKAISEIVQDSGLERGREPFIELLARLSPAENRDLLRSLIEEPGMEGHAIKALRVGKIFSEQEKVKEILESSKKGWVRREARKYLVRCEA